MFSLFLLFIYLNIGAFFAAYYANKHRLTNIRKEEEAEIFLLYLWPCYLINLLTKSLISFYSFLFTSRKSYLPKWMK